MGKAFYFPTKIIYSNDSITDLLQELDNQGQVRVIFLTDTGLITAGIVEPFLKKLAEGNLPVEVFSNIPGNPNVPDLMPAFEAARKINATHVVALGGGSVIDTAKAVGILLANPEMDWEDLQWGRVKVGNPSFPVIAIPTTAGTGSEVTKVTVIGDRKGFKKGFLHPFVFTKTAIIDGSLTLSLPPKLTAATGMDALVHAIEAYTGKRANPMTDVLALGAIRSIIRWLPEATHNGKNAEARQAMSEAASLAGIAFDQSGLALAHAIGGPLTATYHLHHGLGIASLLPATLSFNAPAISEARIKELKFALNITENVNTEDLANWSRKFIIDLGLPVKLGEVGLLKTDIKAIAEGTTHMAMFGNNIRQASEEDLVSLLEANF